jgi:hypothetical protein
MFFDEFFYVFQSSWPVESGAECFTDQCSWSGMIFTVTWVDFSYDLFAFFYETHLRSTPNDAALLYKLFPART